MSDTKNAKVVIVDDSDFSRSVISRMLSDEGVQVVGEAASAEAALSILNEKKPDVLIVDIVMPNVSGLELAKKVNTAFPQISVIVISSLSQEHIVLDAINSGADDFIPKPIQKHQLIDSIEKIMAGREKD